MRPVRKNGNHRVFSGIKALEQELGLTSAKMQDSGDPRGNSVAQRREIAVNEKMMVCCALSLVGGRSDLDTTRRKKDSDLRTCHQRRLSGFDDLDDPRMPHLAAGKRR